MRINRYQLRACLRAVKSFVPYRLRRFVRYGLYVVCLLAGFLLGYLCALRLFDFPVGGVFL